MIINLCGLKSEHLYTSYNQTYRQSFFNKGSMVDKETKYAYMALFYRQPTILAQY